MQSSVSRLKPKPVRALVQPPPQDEETAVLDLLDNGVFVVSAELDHDTIQEPVLCFANRALCDLVDVRSASVVDKPLTAIFPKSRYRTLHDALHQVISLESGHKFELAYHQNGQAKQFRISIVPYGGSAFAPHKAPSITGNECRQVIGCITDITDLAVRANYLEERAVKLIDHVNVVEGTRRNLEKEVKLLRRTLNSMERSSHFDASTGLPNRSYFLERGAAEFRRSVRYEHELSTVVARVQGFAEIVEKHGDAAGVSAMTGLSQVCESVYRNGADIAGRIADAEIGLILPETGLAGALQFVERLKEAVAATPIQIGDNFVRLGILANCESVQNEDRGFTDSLSRARSGLREL